MDNFDQFLESEDSWEDFQAAIAEVSPPPPPEIPEVAPTYAAPEAPEIPEVSPTLPPAVPPVAPVAPPAPEKVDPLDTFLDSDVSWEEAQKPMAEPAPFEPRVIKPGVTVGAFPDPAMEPIYEELALPVPPERISPEEAFKTYNIMGGVEDIGKFAYDIPVNLIGATASLFEDDNPEAEYDWKDIARRTQEDRNKMRMAEPGAEEYVLPWVQRKDIRQAAASAGFSGVAMTSAVLAGAAAFPIPVPGTTPAAAMAGAGTTAYKMDKAMFTQQIIDAARIDNPSITPEEVTKLVEDTKGIRMKHALWEAIPEAIGNAAQLTGIGMLFKAALGKKLGARIFQTLVGMYGAELSTEVVTQMGQHNAEIEAGLATGEKRSFTSLEDLKDSLKEVGPQTFVLVTLTGGFGAGAAKTYQLATAKVKGAEKIKVEPPVTEAAPPVTEEPTPGAPSIDEVRAKYDAGEFTDEDLSAIRDIWSDDVEMVSAIDKIVKPVVKKPAEEVVPTAEFLGYQERPGKAPMPLYNIIGGKRAGSTVTVPTLKEEGIAIPETPSVEEAAKVKPKAPAKPAKKAPVIKAVPEPEMRTKLLAKLKKDRPDIAEKDAIKMVDDAIAKTEEFMPAEFSIAPATAADIKEELKLTQFKRKAPEDSYAIRKGRARVGHIVGESSEVYKTSNILKDNPELGLKVGDTYYRIHNTRLEKEHRGKGIYQEKIQEIANKYTAGALVHKFEASTALQKALKKIPGVVETDRVILIPPVRVKEEIALKPPKALVEKYEAGKTKLPTDTNWPAIKLENGDILFDKEIATHAQIINDSGVNPENVKEGGWITAEGYRESPSDATRIAERAKAKKRVVEKRMKRLAAKPKVIEPAEFSVAVKDLAETKITGKEQQKDVKKAFAIIEGGKYEYIEKLPKGVLEQVKPVRKEDAEAEAAAQIVALKADRFSDQTISTVAEAQAWLKVNGFPTIAKPAESSTLIADLVKNEAFNELSIFDRIRVAAQLERPIRRGDYKPVVSLGGNRKTAGVLGLQHTGSISRSTGDNAIQITDAVAGCDQYCYECYALKGAAQATKSHQHPILAEITGYLRTGEMLRVGEKGDASRAWAHTNKEIEKLIARSREKGQDVSMDNVFYTTKLLSLNGFDPKINRHLQVTLDPLYPDHMIRTMENILRLKSAHPNVTVVARVRSFYSNNKDLNESLQMAVEFANKYKLPVLETRLRFIRKSSFDVLELDRDQYKRVGNQFKMKTPAIADEADNYHLCDMKEAACPACKNCTKLVKMRKKLIPAQTKAIKDAGIDGISIAASQAFDPVGLTEEGLVPEFRLRPEKVKGERTTANQVTDIITPILRTWTNIPAVRVVPTVGELPKALRTQATAQERKTKGKVEGLYDPETDQVFLVAGNLSESRIEDVLRHEAEGHRGLRLMMGSDLNSFLDKVAAAKKAELLEIAPGLNFKDKAAVRNTANEWAARHIEAGTMKPLWHGRLIYAIRQWLRKLFPGLKMSDADIKVALYDTVMNVRRGPVRVIMTERQKATALSSERAVQWHSQMANVLKQKLPGKGTPESFVQTINSFVKKGEFKQEELEWSGIIEWLENQKGKISKQDVLDSLSENNVRIEEVEKGFAPRDDKRLRELDNRIRSGEYLSPTEVEEYHRIAGQEAFPETQGTKFGQYVLPGGKGYREMLLIMPRVYKAPKIEWEAKSLYGLKEGEIEYVSEYDGETYIISMLPAGGYRSRHIPQATLSPVTIVTTSTLDAAKRSVADYATDIPPTYKGSHWEEENVLAHVRFDERRAGAPYVVTVKDRTGKSTVTFDTLKEAESFASVKKRGGYTSTIEPQGKVLHIAEIQSDWHREGREKGYAYVKKPDPMVVELRELQRHHLHLQIQPFESEDVKKKAKDKFHALWDKVYKKYDTPESKPLDEFFSEKLPKGAIPDAPFKKTWPLLTIKRMVRYAAEGGYDAVSWDTGAVQAARYDLSKQIDSLEWERHAAIHAGAADTYDLAGIKDGEKVLEQEDIEEADLPNLVGKDVADKIISHIQFDQGELEGLDLAVGGAGMKSFYDKLLPNVVNKFFNKATWGKAKVGTTTLPAVALDIKPYEVIVVGGENRNFATREEAVAFREAEPDATGIVGPVSGFEMPTMEATKAWVLPITPEMKTKAIHEGMPLFSVKRELTEKERAFLEKHYPEKLAALDKKTGGNIIKESKADAEVFTEMGEIPSSPEGFNMPHEGKGRQVFNLLQFKIQDRFNSLRRVQETIEKTTATEMPEAANAYQTEELYHGKVAERMGAFDSELIDPLVEEIHESEFELEDVEEYLYARHAPEANRQLEKINPKRKDNKALSGISTSDAIEVLTKYSGNKAMESIAAKVDAITKGTRNILVKEGLATAEEIKAWEGAYKYYIPLKRDMADAGMPKKGAGVNIIGPESKRRLTGSAERQAANILANIVSQHEAIIIRAEKAKVGRAMLKLAEAHPNKELWEVDAKELKPFLKQRKSKEIDEATGLPQTLNEVVLGRDILYKFNDNVLVVKVDGIERTITFNKDNVHAQRIVRSMKNLGAADMSAVIKTLSTVNRWLAIVNTSANPEFIISNFARDIQTAGYNINDTQAKNLKVKVFKDVFRALQGIRRGIRGDFSSEWAKNYQDFVKAGAQTGWTDHYKNIEDREKSLKKKLNLMKDGTWRSVQRGAKGMYEFIGNENTAVENAIRLSIYTHLKAAGATDAVAASAAKNLTVNFNRRGDMGQTLNAMYLFFNANVQGSARLIYAAGRSPTVRKMMYGTVAFAAMLDIANRVIGGEDDDGENRYDKVPHWVKEHNLVLMRPNGDYFKLPLPWGYNTLHVLGQSIGEAVDPNTDKFDAMAAAGRLGSAVLGSFNPLGSESTLLQLAAPTIADPFVQWAENKNFAGIPIKPEQMPFDVAKPEYQLYFQSARKPSRWVAKMLSDLTGGDEVRPGLVDVSPEVFDLFIDTLVGGAGKFMDNTIKLPAELAKKDPEIRKVPFVKKVYGEAPDYYLRTKFYDNLSEVRYAQKSVDHYEDDKNKAASTRRKYSWEMRFITRAKRDKKKIGDLRKKRNRIEKGDESKRIKEAKVEDIEKQITQIMTDFNRTYKKKAGGVYVAMPSPQTTGYVPRKPLTLREAMQAK